MRAEILTVGTELLLGHTVDTNSAYLSRRLAGLGFDLYFKATVGDNRQRVARTIGEALARVDLLLTTGGLGPTLDDITREAVADATGRSLEFRPELLAEIEARFRRLGLRMSDNNRRQAYLPRGAIGIPNPVGSAPGFYLEADKGALACLPGVPSETVYLMDEALVPLLRQRYPDTGTIVSCTLKVAGLPESRVDELLDELMLNPNPTVGLSAQTGEIRVRITARAPSGEATQALIADVEAEVRRRLGDHIFGADEESLAGAALRLLSERGLTVSSLETFSGGLLAQRLMEGSESGAYRGGLVLPDTAWPPERAAAEARERTGSDWALVLLSNGEKARALVSGPGPEWERELGYDTRLPERFRTWAVNLALRLLWEAVR